MEPARIATKRCDSIANILAQKLLVGFVRVKFISYPPIEMVILWRTGRGGLRVLNEVGQWSHVVFRELAQGKNAVTARIFDQRDLRDDSVDWIIRQSRPKANRISNFSSIVHQIFMKYC